MSSEVIRELFRSLESTMRQRMDVIEEIVRHIKPVPVPVPVSAPIPVVTAPTNEANFQRMNDRINSLAEMFLQSFNELTREVSRLGVEMGRMKETSVAPVVADSDADDTPVEAVEAEVEAEVAEAEALETPDESVEEEVEELELEEFTWKGQTYYRDGDNNVYGQDEEGDIMDDPIGTWNGKKIVRA